MQVQNVRRLPDARVQVEQVKREHPTSKEEKKALRELSHRAQGCSAESYALRRRVFGAHDEFLNADRSLAELPLDADSTIKPTSRKSSQTFSELRRGDCARRILCTQSLNRGKRVNQRALRDVADGNELIRPV